MASANKRLNERLAKYNHLYDGEEEQAEIASSADETDDAAVVNGNAEHDSEPLTTNSNDNNNVIEPERVPVKKIMENVSLHVNGVDTTEGMQLAENGGVVIPGSTHANLSGHVSV